MTFAKRSWFVIDAFILVLVLLTTPLIYWQMLRGDELLPTGLASSGLVGVGRDQKTTTGSDQALKTLLSSGVSLDNLQDLPQPVIQRLSDQLETITRGSIFDRDGRLLANDHLDSQGNRVRFYTEPSLANVIGSVSGLGIGISGLEHAHNGQLLGLNSLNASINHMLHLPVTGDDLILTIDSNLQRKAEEALKGRAGSITVLDAHTGAILAMTSLPRFDPNRFLEEGYLSNLLAGCNSSPQCSGFLLNRATQALYTPGSTWKTVTLIAALDSGEISPDAVFDFGEPVQSANGPYYVYRVDGGVITDPNHTESRLSLEMSYAKSANAAFARIGNEMSPGILIDYAARFGFSAPSDKRFLFNFDFSPAQLANNVNSLYSNNLLRAVTAIGQGELLTSPLNMGMVVLSVYNNGEMPLPYLVYGERNHSGSQAVVQPERVVIHKIMKPETAQIVRRMMETVVTKGSGGKAAIAGVDVGGKTGTAQVGGDLPPHAWFTGFAQEGDRAVVVVVMIENGGEGSLVAAPIFANIAAAALHLSITPVQENVPEPVTPTPAVTENAPVPSLAATPVVKEATPSPTPLIPGVPPPDIPYKAGVVDFTERDPSCPGNQKGPVGSGKFIWPSIFQGISGSNFSASHPGVDLAVPTGSPVYAADTGLVIFAGWSDLGYGNTIVIDHGNGYKTLYGHLSQVSEYCGAIVKVGHVIGLSGNTGNSTGQHLHFEVRVPGGYLNPLKVLPTP
ncbi:MAG TPA: penicillin-binding transpeptidase domain-containing protein [Anaerolineaceae bacterium]